MAKPRYLVAAGLVAAAMAPQLLVVATPHQLPTLSCHMTARFSYKEAGEGAQPEQTVDAKLYINGKNVRFESQMGDRPVVFLYAPPYGYKLLPTTHSGVRWRAGASVLPQAADKFDLQMLLQNPTAIRAALQRKGAQRVGAGQLNGTPVDIYVANNLLVMNQPHKAKAWLRHSDALPVRLELTSRKFSATASWRDYRRGQALPGSLFTVPGGYRIRDAQTQQSIM